MDFKKILKIKGLKYWVATAVFAVVILFLDQNNLLVTMKLGRQVNQLHNQEEELREAIVQDSINNVLQYFRACNSALLVNVANKYHWHTTGLGIAQEGCGTLTHLAHRASGAVELIACDCLYGIDNHEVGGALLFLVAASDAVGTHA